jgi:type VI protein secretion system component Hcp
MKSAIRRGKTSGLAVLLIVIAIAMVPTAASAAVQIVMLVPNIPGSSTVNGHTGWIDVLSFAGSAVASTAGAKPCQMVVQKKLDIASPHLWLATVTGVVFSDIKIDLIAVAGTTQFVAGEIQLENAQITSIGDGGSSTLTEESVAFKAAKGIVTFNERNPSTGGITPITVSFTC